VIDKVSYWHINQREEIQTSLATKIEEEYTCEELAKSIQGIV
jgi:hypothetical protein